MSKNWKQLRRRLDDSRGGKGSSLEASQSFPGPVLQVALKARLDGLYQRFNRPEFIATDPLQHLYGYDDPADREVVGFVTASLSYGRVSQINKTVAGVLRRLTSSPSSFLATASPGDLHRLFSDFCYRFTTGEELAALLGALGAMIRSGGSLNTWFVRYLHRDDRTVLSALDRFAVHVARESGTMGGCNSLLPAPAAGSACKRLHLFLRWMVRRDDVDPGGWTGVSPSLLLIPLDVHMHRVALALGFTRRRQADLKAVLEITDAFRAIDPADPVRYDFALTRQGIMRGMAASLLEAS